MLLSIRHTTRYVYEPAVQQATLRLKFIPPRTSAQTIRRWDLTVNGAAVTPLMTDAAGNIVALWHAHGKTDTIEIVGAGEVETTDTAGVLGGLDQIARPGVFLRIGRLTEADEAIRALVAKVSGDDLLGRLHMLSSLVREAIDYRPGATTAATTAIEAAAIGAGVCQDHSHVFIAACRSMDVPARYVTGYLWDADGELRVGDQTHGWAETFVEGLGWVGFDVTNQLCPTDAYVRLGCGLDAADAAPMRGVLVGRPDETLPVDVVVERARAQAQSQAQSRISR